MSSIYSQQKGVGENLHQSGVISQDPEKSHSLPPMGEAVGFYLILQYFDFVDLVGIRVYDMDAAGNAGIK